MLKIFMFTTVEGYFQSWQPSRTGKLKYLVIQTPESLLQIKVGKSLRTLLKHTIEPHNYLVIKVEIAKNCTKAISVSILPTVQQQPVANPTKIQVCSKGTCRKKGSGEICAALQAMVRDRNLQNAVLVEEVGCLKECKHAPNVRLKPSGDICHHASPAMVSTLLPPELCTN